MQAFDQKFSVAMQEFLGKFVSLHQTYKQNER